MSPRISDFPGAVGTPPAGDATRGFSGPIPPMEPAAADRPHRHPVELEARDDEADAGDRGTRS